MGDYNKTYRLPEGTVISLKMKSINKMLKEKGFGEGGHIQRFHTANVLRRIVKYMPFRSGMTIKVSIIQTDINKPFLRTNTPFAQKLFKGKRKNGAPINYGKSKNPKAGPRWDLALIAAEGAVLQAELQAEIDRRKNNV